MNRKAPAPAVLLLANNGINNPSLWSDWATRDAAHPIRLYAACENSRTDSICRDQSVSIEFVKSEWCGKGIAQNTLAALRYIANLPYPPPIIYLASGSCLPVQSSSYLYRETIVLPKGHTNAKQRWYPSKPSMTVVKRYPDYVECTQWISLTPDLIHQIKDDAKLLRRKETRSCPDEVYIQTLVDRLGPNATAYQDVPFTDQCKEKSDSPSPITWDLDHDSRRHQISWDDQTYKHFTALQSLQFAHRSGYVFARKYAPTKHTDFASFLALL